MKALHRVGIVAVICGMGMMAAGDAEARCGILKKLFNRGGGSSCCTPCKPVCCQPAPQPCCSAPVADCGCGAVPAASDCGCGTVMSGEIMSGEIIVDESNQPTEAASPSDAMPEVPEPPAAEEATETAEEAVEEATEAAVEATTEA